MWKKRSEGMSKGNSNQHDNLTGSKPILAFLAMLAVTVIYATTMVSSRYAAQNGLSQYDLTALRYFVASFILFPLFISMAFKYQSKTGKGFIRALFGELGWKRSVLITILGGAPYMMVIFAGLKLAPSSHGAVFNSAVVPCVVFLGMSFLGIEKISLRKLLALAGIIVGLILVSSASFSSQSEVLTGDALILLTGISWGIFTILCKIWQVKALEVTVIVSTLSLVYLPFYFLMHFNGPVTDLIQNAGVAHIVFQGIFQGIISSVFSLYFMTYALKKLTANQVAMFYPLIPILTVLIAMPFLGEYPGIKQGAGVALVAVCMYFILSKQKAESALKTEVADDKDNIDESPALRANTTENLLNHTKL